MAGIWIVASEFHPQNRKISSFLKRETFKILSFFQAGKTNQNISKDFGKN